MVKGCTLGKDAPNELMGDFTAALLVRALWIAVENPAPYFSEFGALNGYGVSKFTASVCQDNWEQTAILFVPKGFIQPMKYKLSKIQDYSFDRKKNPYLSEEEAYRIGLNIKELFYKSFSELPKRVVIHKRTPFRKEEVKGLVESLSSAGVKNIELLEITYEDNLKCFALNERCTQVDGYPVRRGMCFPIDKNTMYLFTHGIAPSVISPNRRYFQGGKSVPLPLKVVKHYGSGDMAQIATEILGLSKMNWNSFGLYSKLPCTIESSNEIARIGWLLSQFEGTLYDYRYFM